MELDDAVLEDLGRLSSPTIANAIELFDARPRDEGVTTRPLPYLTPHLGVAVGYAATIRITSNGGTNLRENVELFPASWRHVQEQPSPRIVVVEDVDAEPGAGAYWGEVNAAIHRALGCDAVITNGAVRDLPEMAAGGFRVFAGMLAVSHAYVRILEIGCPVTVAGLRVEPGDLLHADSHGVVNVPTDLAPQIPAMAQKLEAREREVIALCESGRFGVDALVAAMGLGTGG